MHIESLIKEVRALPFPLRQYIAAISATNQDEARMVIAFIREQWNINEQPTKD